ncbi:MAG: SusD/RagB family nutrient-binding outer membrane lipoprotein [Bacteroidota bacterium]
MKKFITKTLLIVLLVAGITACSDDYFDVNTPSGTAQPEQLRMSDLLAPVIHSTLEGQRSAALPFGNYTQNFVGQGGTAIGLTSASGLWSQVYLYILPNLKVIKEKAQDKGAIHYGAVADILTAINIGIATDTWDNIPYSQATQAQDNLTPAFDSQESIYNELFALLDGAIAALEATDDSGISLGREDLIYGGDVDKWLRAAYTLKARYQLHLINVNGLASAGAAALATIEKGFTSNADDFQMFYDEKNINPWYSGEILARNTGNLHRDIASQLVSSMNGDYYPFESGLLEIDPRLPTMAQIPDGDTEWKGFVSGAGGPSPDGTDANTFFKTDGYYTSIDSPLSLITYAEAMFIKAEAAFLANGGNETSIGSTGDAYMAYMEGVRASMDMYGVNGSDYMDDTSIDVGEGALMLNHIMKEKYIHNFLNPETFVDYRRYDFSDEVFKGLTIRSEDDADDSEYAGQWFRRAVYPDTELNRNESNVLANQKTPVTPVWWDQ